ncbi:hypothetical protein ACVWY0_001261 [Arthrobacter sp. UYNi723]
MSPRTNGFYAEQPEYTGTTITEITVPSGRLIAADDLRSVEHFNIEAPLSINSGVGLDVLAVLTAQQANTAYAFVGNTSPMVTRHADGSVEVVSPDWPDDADIPVFKDGENMVAEICTDLWATMLTDYQNWLDHGGPDISTANEDFAIEKFTVLDVTPGKYRWTVYSHADRFDIHARGRVTFARLELIESY